MTEEQLDIELPHDAWYDDQAGMVTFTIDRCTFSFTVEEFFQFASQIDDVAQVFSQMIEMKATKCDACGTQLETLTLVAPTEEEFN